MADKTPDLNLLPIAVAVYDELSVSRAARGLGMSQPAVSKALGRLRDTFGDPLFIRGPGGMVATPRAQAIVRAARPRLRHLQEDLLEGERFDPATSARQIVLGLSEIGELAFVPSILERLRTIAPKCPVNTATLPDERLAYGLERGDIDVAVGHFPELAQRNFRQRRLSRHGFACLMRAGHPLWSSRLTLASYLAAEHIVIRPAGRSQGVLEKFLNRRRLRRDVALYTSNVLSTPFIVMDTQLVATLPYAVATHFAAFSRQVVAALPPFDVAYDLNLHWHRRFDKEPRSLWLRKQLSAVFKERRWLERPAGPEPFLDS